MRWKKAKGEFGTVFCLFCESSFSCLVNLTESRVVLLRKSLTNKLQIFDKNDLVLGLTCFLFK